MGLGTDTALTAVSFDDGGRKVPVRLIERRSSLDPPRLARTQALPIA